ncbi:hypothetical protein M405DRAFT_866124 [Rhizopogon salebrosus TDB-379]|nr:hypothetical protein M405DRAFT_866124 [Rhizopogon salebrosus TDB-379]
MTAQPKRVLVIGGGPCGLVTSQTPEMSHWTFSRVQLVERQDVVDGTVCAGTHVPAEDYRPRRSRPAYQVLIGNDLPDPTRISPPLRAGPFEVPRTPQIFPYAPRLQRRTPMLLLLTFSRNPLIHTTAERLKGLKNELMILQKIVARDSLTPAYPGLMGNVRFLRSNFGETNAYIKAFALPFVESGRVRMSREVIDVEEVESGGAWRVRMKD